MIVHLAILVGVLLSLGSLGHIYELVLLVFHQNVVLFVQDTLGKNLALTHVLDDVSDVGLVFKALFAFPYYFALVVLGAFEYTEAVAFNVLVEEDVKPGK